MMEKAIIYAISPRLIMKLVAMKINKHFREERIHEQSRISCSDCRKTEFSKDSEKALKAFIDVVTEELKKVVRYN